MGRLVIDGGDVYELDENCLREKNAKRNQLMNQYPKRQKNGLKQEAGNKRTGNKM